MQNNISRSWGEEEQIGPTNLPAVLYHSVFIQNYLELVIRGSLLINISSNISAENTRYWRCFSPPRSLNIKSFIAFFFYLKQKQEGRGRSLLLASLVLMMFHQVTCILWQYARFLVYCTGEHLWVHSTENFCLSTWSQKYWVLSERLKELLLCCHLNSQSPNLWLQRGRVPWRFFCFLHGWKDIHFSWDLFMTFEIWLAMSHSSSHRIHIHI